MAITSLQDLIASASRAWPVVSDATGRGNIKMLRSFLGPAYRGLFLQCAKDADFSVMRPAHDVHYDWRYSHNFAEMGKLYESAKANQWDATSTLDWSQEVDPLALDDTLLPDSFCPASTLPVWMKLSEKERAIQRQALLSWVLSQILHGEQGALYAASQVMQAVPWLDAKLLGASQVMDEARHVEVFHRYLQQKLERMWDVNDNLYVLIEALMQDTRWDVKFLGMQIMVEGFALGAFATIRKLTKEPLLKSILTQVITDEARHVHYGVLALERFYRTEVSENERREREDWAFEVCLLLQRRFLAQEIYDTYYGHIFSRAEWNRLASQSELMLFFRKAMFQLIIPNLKRLGLLTDRIRPKYVGLGILHYESGRAAPELTAHDILEGNSA